MDIYLIIRWFYKGRMSALSEIEIGALNKNYKT